MVAVNIDQLRSSESHEPGDADSRETRRIPANGLAPSTRDQHERISENSALRSRESAIQNVVGLRLRTKTESHELDPALHRELERIAQGVAGKAAVLVGGRAAQSHALMLEPMGATVLPDLSSLRAWLRNYR
jgi:hypothetical protein